MAFRLQFEKLQKNQVMKAVFMKHKFAYRVMPFFPGIYDFYKTFNFVFCIQRDPLFNVLCVQQKNEWIPGRNDVLWIHLC